MYYYSNIYIYFLLLTRKIFRDAVTPDTTFHGVIINHFSPSLSSSSFSNYNIHDQINHYQCFWCAKRECGWKIKKKIKGKGVKSKILQSQWCNLAEKVPLLGYSGGVVNSLDFCPASLKSLGCFYFRCVLSLHW